MSEIHRLRRLHGLKERGKMEVRERQRTDVRGQKTEDGGRKKSPDFYCFPDINCL